MQYSFAAISPASAVQGDLNASNIIKFTTDGTIDLIYAVEEVQPAATYNDVAFKFEHLLSKVMFSFATDLPAGNEVSIEELQLYTTIEADYDLAGKAWDTSAATKHTWFIDLNANNESEDYFIIPDECYVSFVVVIKVGDVEVYRQVKDATLSADSFVMGHAYNLRAEINENTLALDEIVFNVDNVKEWEDPQTETIGA